MVGNAHHLAARFLARPLVASWIKSYQSAFKPHQAAPLAFSKLFSQVPAACVGVRTHRRSEIALQCQEVMAMPRVKLITKPFQHLATLRKRAAREGAGASAWVGPSDTRKPAKRMGEPRWPGKRLSGGGGGLRKEGNPPVPARGRSKVPTYFEGVFGNRKGTSRISFSEPGSTSWNPFTTCPIILWSSDQREPTDAPHSRR
jgi:hypothetical protein